MKKKQMSAFDRDTLLSKVVPLTPDNPNWTKHFGAADVVIEAVPENLALKHKVVRACAYARAFVCVRMCVCARLDCGEV